jgi:hypothetical protein
MGWGGFWLDYPLDKYLLDYSFDDMLESRIPKNPKALQTLINNNN